MTYLPFDARFHDAIRSGHKRLTARTRRYGMPGDVVNSPVGPIELEEVERATLERVAEELYGEEGCASPEEFKRVWRKLHPRAGYRPDAQVYLHRFRLREP